jgi:hypothetical protein
MHEANHPPRYGNYAFGIHKRCERRVNNSTAIVAVCHAMHGDQQRRLGGI